MALLQVDDAFVRGSEDGSTWTLGTGAVEATYSASDGCFALTTFTNKLTSPSTE